MKKLTVLFLVSILTVVLFSGCTGIDRSNSASVSFYFDGAFVSKLVSGVNPRSSRDLTDGEDTSGLFLSISLRGDYTGTQTISLGEEESYLVNFEDIPVGSSVSASAILYYKEMVDNSYYYYAEYFGESSTVSIASGDNTLDLSISEMYSDSLVKTMQGTNEDGDSFYTLYAYDNGVYLIFCDKNLISTGLWKGTEDSEGHMNSVTITEEAYVSSDNSSLVLVTSPSTKTYDVSEGSLTITSKNGMKLYFAESQESTFSVTLETLESDEEGVVSLTWDETEGTLTATIADGYSLYSWTVNGSDYESTETQILVSELDLTGGYHDIMVTVIDSTSNPYTATATVLVSSN